MASIMQRFERSQLIWRRSSDHSKLISTEEMVRLVVQNKHHLWDPGYTSLEGYRDLYKTSASRCVPSPPGESTTRKVARCPC